MATHSCSCLENPRDGEAWWAAVCGVAQSRTRLKRLSSKGLPGGACGKELACQCRRPRFYPWVGKIIPWRREWLPTPVFLSGELHGQKSLVGYSPWGCKESKSRTRLEQLHFHFSLSCIGEGNGNPLVFLPGESQGQGSLVGCRLWGRTESDMPEAT